MRAFDFASNSPWLITDEALQTILAIAQRTNDVEALAARESKPLITGRRTLVRDWTAIIPVTGPIFRRANMFTEISGATSTEVLATDLQAAIEDPTIRSIVLDIDSPGGAAAGIHELGEMIFEARDQKRIVAYVGGQMASAAYWIGSGAHEIVADRTAILGSIGAKLTILDTSARDLKSGVRQIEIVSSQSPDKVLDPTLDEGRAKLQKIVDDLAGVFVSAVARNRGIDVEEVLANYGRGGQMVGQNAVDAGLADRLGSLESVLAELESDRIPQRRSFIMTKVKGPITISTQTELQAALTAGHTPEEITIATVDTDAIKAAAKAEALAAVEPVHAAAVAKASTDAVAAERTRIAGLQAIAMKGFEKEIEAAVESGASVEATAISISKLAKERGVTVSALRDDASNPANHGGADSNGANASAKPWGTITARANKRKAS